MRLETGQFFGKVDKQVALDYFNLTLTTYKPEYATAKHHHQTPYLSLLLSGGYTEIAKGNEQMVSTGNTIFRPGDYAHMNKFDSSMGRCFNIEIKGEAFPFFEEGLKKRKVLFFNHSSVGLYLILQNFFTGTGTSLNNLTFELCSDLFGQQSERGHGRALWIKSVMDFIRDVPDQEHSIEKIAKIVNVHPVYLVRKFKEKTGTSLSHFITGVRLQQALHKMIKGKENLTDITYSCGFYDQSHFIRTFKSFFGFPPGYFLKAVKG